MSNYVIVTDSCCDLSHSMAHEMGLGLIRLDVLVENKTYTNWLDWREIPAGDFYDLMRAEKSASTSAPSIGDFVHAFEPYLQAGKDVLYLGFSSGLTFTVAGVSVPLTGLAIAAIAGVVLNAILPGNDYTFGE